MKKRGEAFQNLIGLATAVAAVAVILVVTFLIIGTGKDQMTVDTVEYNATQLVNVAVADGIPPFLPIIIIAGIGVVLLGLVALFSRR